MRLLNLGLSLSVSTENNIQVVYGRGQLRGKIIAWKCVFPNKSHLKSLLAHSLALQMIQNQE